MAKMSLFDRRRRRVRTALKAKGAVLGSSRPRLSIHRSGRHIYAQLIDDAQGRTLAAASSLDGAFKEDGGKGKTGATTAAAAEVGKRVAERAVAAGVTTVVFDRGGFLYHGRVKALADAARASGLEF